MLTTIYVHPLGDLISRGSRGHVHNDSQIFSHSLDLCVRPDTSISMFHRCLSFHRHRTHCLSPNTFFSSATSFLSEKHHHTPDLRNHKPEIRHRRLPPSHSCDPQSACSPPPVLGRAPPVPSTPGKKQAGDKF